MEEISKNYARNVQESITEDYITNEMTNLVNNYMVIYREYYDTYSRDSAFLKDLADAIIGIEACLEVYARDKHINSNYALEKLNSSKQIIDNTIEYFKGKESNENR